MIDSGELFVEDSVDDSTGYSFDDSIVVGDSVEVSVEDSVDDSTVVVDIGSSVGLPYRWCLTGIYQLYAPIYRIGNMHPKEAKTRSLPNALRHWLHCYNVQRWERISLKRSEDIHINFLEWNVDCVVTGVE